MTTLELVHQALATVSDPELHRPLPDLGMVESVSINGSQAELKILLTISVAQCKIDLDQISLQR